jgi:hypothetical protein
MKHMKAQFQTPSDTAEIPLAATLDLNLTPNLNLPPASPDASSQRPAPCGPPGPSPVTSMVPRNFPPASSAKSAVTFRFPHQASLIMINPAHIPPLFPVNFSSLRGGRACDKLSPRSTLQARISTLFHIFPLYIFFPQANRRPHLPSVPPGLAPLKTPEGSSRQLRSRGQMNRPSGAYPNSLPNPPLFHPYFTFLTFPGPYSRVSRLSRLFLFFSGREPEVRTIGVSKPSPIQGRLIIVVSQCREIHVFTQKNTIKSGGGGGCPPSAAPS